MNNKERGFLLLTSTLGNPERKTLTVAQFRILAHRVSQLDRPNESRELTEADLLALGYDRSMAFRIIALLSEEELLDRYLWKGARHNCVPVSRASEKYPLAVRKRLGLDAPGCLWAKGDISILDNQAVSLVGSRALREENRKFAEIAGREVAHQGYTLVSGNARGADRTAQDACLAAGGKVISIVADELEKYPLTENVLYLSEDGFDLPFSSARALSRNRVIHSLGYITLVAQCDLGTGGTWDGTVKNLQKGWSPVFCFSDGSPAMTELSQLGGKQIDISRLSHLAQLEPDARSFVL